jgi:hypothetical protein
MAGMTLGGAPPAGAGMMMPPHMGPGAGAPGMVAAYPGAPVMHPGMGGGMPPAAAVGHNPFLTGPASGPTSGGACSSIAIQMDRTATAMMLTLLRAHQAC